MKKIILILFSLIFLSQQVFAITLFEALNETYKNNTDLNAERENISISEDDLKISKSNYLPSVIISGSKSQENTNKLTNRTGVEQSVNDVDPSTQSIKIEQSLIDFSRNANVLKNKKERLFFGYENGIRLNFVHNIFEIYFPLYSNNGWEISQTSYAQNIRFTFTGNVNLHNVSSPILSIKDTCNNYT